MVHYLNKKDMIRRKNYNRFELSLYLLKNCLVDTRISFISRFLLKSCFQQRKLRFHGNTKLRQRCMETGRSRFVLRNYSLSRATFKSFASRGFFCGLIKH